MQSKKVFKRLVSAALSVTTASQLLMAALPQSIFALSLNTDFVIYSDEDITINTNKAVLNGNVFSGDDFAYLGNDTCYVNKTLNADKQSGKITAKETEDARTKKPDYTSQLKNGVDYKTIYTEDTVLDAAEYDLHNSIYAKGKLRIDRTAFKGKGYIRAKNSIQYNAVQNDENGEIFLYSESGNITLQGANLTINGIIYAPEGTVEINAKNLTFNGTIVAKNVEFNGTNLTVNEIKDKSTSLIQFGPDLTIEGIEDTYKENRKITLDISKSFGIDDIDTDTLVWSFTAEDYKNSDCIKIDETTSNNLVKNLIITKKGTYRVNITGKDKDGNDIRYYDLIEVVEDIAPVAGYWKEAEFAVRDGEGNAEITLEDTSYSLDGDTIGSRVWSVIFDSNNDGDFSDEKEEIFNAGNETTVTYKATSVGNYRFRLSVAEVIEDTIPSLITEDAYKLSTTDSMKSKATDIEVVNTAPDSYSGISKAKNVDIVVTVGNADLDDIDALNKNIKGVKERLEKKGYSVNLSTVSTSTLTAKDTFAWDEYDHYGYVDSYLPTLDKHILFEDDSIKMVGYSWAPLRDWLFVDDGLKAKRILSFDMVRDRTDWHSMEGGGFLFNTKIYDEVQPTDDPTAEPVTIKKMDGYCIILTAGGFKLVQLNNLDVDKFRDGGVSGSVQSAGKVLVSVPVGDAYADYNVKIVASSRILSVFINDEPVIDNYVLPDTETGTGFGPIICHGGHGCSQQSYFTFSNIKMTTVNGSELSDVLDKFKWRDSAEHYVLNLSKQKVFDLANEESVGSAVKSLIEKKTDFIGLGTSDSKEQYDLLLKSADGVYIDWYDLLKNEELLEKYILNDLSGIDYSITNNRVSTSDQVVYKDYYVDKENDPIGKQVWEYELDASVYENSKGKSGKFTAKKPLETFDATGLYKIKSKLQDDPTNGNGSLDGYKEWSKEVKWTDGLYVHSLPTASIKSEVFATNDPNKFLTKLTFEAQDADGLSHKNKGITKEKFEWKCIDDSEWQEGVVPSAIQPEKIYLQKYTVCDEQGEWSIPCIEIVYAEKKENTQKFEDDENPVVTIGVSDEAPSLGDDLLISVSATDNTEVAYVKTTVNGKTVANYQGSVVYNCDREGDLVIKTECKDIAGNTTVETMTVTVTDRRDVTAPQIIIDMDNDVKLDDNKKLTISGYVYDDQELASYKVEYAADGSEEYSQVKESKTEVKGGTIASFTLPGEGKYNVLITASDKAGNTAYSKITLTIEEKTISDTNTEQNTETVTPPDPPARTDSPAEITITASKEKAEIGEVIYVKTEANDKDGLVAVKVYKDDKLIAEAPAEFRFSEAEAKIVNIRVETTDSFGRSDQKSLEIIIEDNRDKVAPTAEITSPAAGSTVSGKVSIKGSAFDETGMRLYTLECKKASDKSFTPICTSYNERKNAELGVWDTYTLDNGVYDLRLSVTDNGGNTKMITAQFEVQNGKDVTEDKLSDELIVITKPDSNTKADKTIKVEAKVDPSLSGKDYKVIIKGSGDSVIVKEGKIGEDGLISATVDSSMYPDGVYTVTTAIESTDSEGNDNSVKKTANVVVKHDLKAADKKYECKITSPKEMEELNNKTEIHAKVSEYAFKKYKFEYSEASKNKFNIFASGDVRGETDIVGEFDTTLLENGYYDIRFTAYGDDTKAEDTITVCVDGSFKLGNFSVSFDDIDTELKGIPVTITSVYDSRTRASSGDLGYGWNLDYSNIKLSISTDQSLNWENSASMSSFIAKYSLVELKKHRIMIDFGNGETEEFAMKISPEGQAFQPLQYGISAYYTSTSGSGAKLVPCDTNPNDLLFNGGRLYDDDFNPYNPQCFAYTSPDGTKYIIDSSKGLISLTTSEGDTITFGDKGIICSGKQYINYKHDKEGRITEISTLSGKSVKYEYDVFGDLVSATDVTGYKKKFKYSKHYLTEIYTPDGVRAARNEYDDDGRLVKTIDADGNSITYDHDVDGREETVKDRNGGITRYVYDDNGHVLSMTDPMGNTHKNTFDANGNPETQTDALGNVTKFKYDKSGKLLETTDAEGIVTKTNYESNGNLKSISINGVDIKSFTYDSKGRIASRTDANGDTTEYTYNGANIASITDNIGSFVKINYNDSKKASTAQSGDGTSCSYVYDDDGNCISRTVTYISDGEEKQITTNYVYDAAGRVISTTDSEGNVVKTEYNSAGKPVVETDQNGGQTKYTYDKLGNLTKVVYPDNTSESFTYDKNGNALTAVDRAGRKATMTYDKAGNLLSKKYDNAPAATTYKYDANYRLIEMTASNGAVTKYEYDKIGRNTAVIDALGSRTEYTYDAFSRQTSMKDAKGNVYKYVYDNKGNLIKTQYPDGTSTSTEYNERGLAVSKTDQNGNKTTFTYDVMNRLTSVTDALGGKTTYEYDNIGNLLKQTDANGNATTYKYDKKGNMIAVENALGQTAEYAYDDKGVLISFTDFGGQTTKYTFNKLGRLTSKKVGNLTTSYNYASDGRLTSVGGNGGSIVYTYDKNGRITKVTYPNGKYVEYAYDENGMNTSVKTPSGTTSYTYDLLGRMTSVTDENGNTTSYIYDKNGSRSSMKYPNGITINYTYDKLSRPVKEVVADKAGNTIASYEYTYGKAGEITHIKEADMDIFYEYDKLLRLVSEKSVSNKAGVKTYSYTYTYDKAGNRTSKTVNGKKITYKYNKLNQLVSGDGATYLYDASGNLVKTEAGSAVSNYKYSDDNKLMEADVNGTVEKYKYDYAGNRLSKQTGDDTVIYVNDCTLSVPQTIEEYDGKGNRLCSYTRGVGLVSQTRDGVVSYYITDAHNSVRMLADADGKITDKYSYDAWGNMIGRDGETDNTLLYCGENYEEHTGYYYLHARYMDPKTGTFTSADTFGGSQNNPITLNKYLYAGANPVMYSDPSGHFLLSISMFNAVTLVSSFVASFVIDFAVNRIVDACMSSILKSSFSNASVCQVDENSEFYEKGKVGKYDYSTFEDLFNFNQMLITINFELCCLCFIADGVSFIKSECNEDMKGIAKGSFSLLRDTKYLADAFNQRYELYDYIFAYAEGDPSCMENLRKTTKRNIHTLGETYEAMFRALVPDTWPSKKYENDFNSRYHNLELGKDFYTLLHGAKDTFINLSEKNGDLGPNDYFDVETLIYGLGIFIATATKAL